MSNSIILVGNTGVGKSFICNKIFERCGSDTRYVSQSSIGSVTGSLQKKSVHFNGKELTIIDTPGFYDCKPGASAAQTAVEDGKNFCKLIRALEESDGILAIVFVFVGRFDITIKTWYDRIVSIIGEGYRGQLIMAHNKENQTTEAELIRNELQLENILGHGSVEYFVFTASAGGNEARTKLNNQTDEFLTKISQRVPFTLSGLVVPEICYEKDEVGEKYEKVISSNLKDEGQTVINKKDGSYYQEEMVWDPNPIRKALGYKVPIRKFHERMVEESVHVKKEVTHRTIGVYRNAYKVRFDGTKDLYEIREIDRRLEKL